MSETCRAELLDCGASKTVCGKEWFSQYVNNLCEEGQQQYHTVKVITCSGLETEKKS